MKYPQFELWRWFVFLTCWSIAAAILAIKPDEPNMYSLAALPSMVSAGCGVLFRATIVCVSATVLAIGAVAGYLYIYGVVTIY